jgi:tetrahydromethanopterin S-methyltransferase subunit E
MEKQYLIISIGMVWFLTIGSLFLTLIGAVAKVQHWQNHQVFLTIGLILFFSSWVIVFGDMVKNNIYNKTFWISTMFILPFIVVLLYLIQRNRLLRLGQRFS